MLTCAGAILHSRMSYSTGCAGSLATLADSNPLPQHPRQRTQLLQCAVRAAALQVLHACGVEITRELLHQPLQSLVASSRSTQHSTRPPGSEESAGTLERLQGQLESHQRDLELRAALSATSSSPDVTRRGGAPSAVGGPSDSQGHRQVGVAERAPTEAASREAAAVDAAGAVGPSGAESVAGAGPGAASTTQQRDALLELAGRSGAALASGTN